MRIVPHSDYLRQMLAAEPMMQAMQDALEAEARERGMRLVRFQDSCWFEPLGENDGHHD